MAQLFIGTFVDTPVLGQLRVRRDHLLGLLRPPSPSQALTIPAISHEGFITHISPLSSPLSTSILRDTPPLRITHIPSHSFLLPTFTDLHLHAPQYLYAGTGLDLPLMQWLDRYAYRAEERIDGDTELARRVYERLVRRLKEAGTGCVVLFGTIGVEAK